MHKTIHSHIIPGEYIRVFDDLAAICQLAGNSLSSRCISIWNHIHEMHDVDFRIGVIMHFAKILCNGVMIKGKRLLSPLDLKAPSITLTRYLCTHILILNLLISVPTTSFYSSVRYLKKRMYNHIIYSIISIYIRY